MIEIDIPMDLMTVEADGVSQGCMTRSRYSIHVGELLVAGRPESWSWVRVKAVDGRHVTFSLVSEAEAAKGARVATDVIRAEWPWPSSNGSGSRNTRSSRLIKEPSCGSTMSSSPST